MRFNNAFEFWEGLKNPNLSKKVYLRTQTQKITYSDLLETIEKLNYRFQNAGLQPGNRIILSTQDDYFTSVFFLAFLRYGITTVLIDPDVPKQRAISIIKQSEVSGFVMDEKLFSEREIDSETGFQLKIKKPAQKKGKLFNRLLKKKNTPTSVDSNAFPEMLETTNPVAFSTRFEDSNLAYILFTSGTTAAPKGVMITHKNLFTHLKTMSRVYGMSEKTNLLNILMLYHADGILQGPVLAAYNCATLIRPFKFDLTRIDEIFHSIYKYRVTHFIAVPTILSLLNKFSEGFEDSFQTEDFQFIVSMASKLELHLWEEFEQKFGTRLVNVFGLTETVNGSIFCGPNDENRKVGTVGKPVDCKAKIIREDGSEAPVGEIGELLLKGDHISPGYFKNDAATREVIKDGWLYSGDYARKDSEGFYQITGRIKNVINSGGVNIYPEQITEMINSNSEVLESVCLGLKDSIFGEKLVSCVVLKSGSELSKLDLFDYLRPRLEQNQLPKEIYFFDDLPKGLSGKIQLKEVLKLLENRSENSSKKTDNLHQKAVFTAASEAFNIEVSKLKIGDTSATVDGWDSMAHLLFVTNLEERYNIRFSTAEVMTMNSLSRAEELLNEKVN